MRTYTEVEEEVYSIRGPDNGSGPLWCLGSTAMVRCEDEVYISVQERNPRYPPLNDCHWALWRRDADGWQEIDADRQQRTREPCPLVALADGRVYLSANPSVQRPDDRGRASPARPEMYEYNGAGPGEGRATGRRVLRPTWSGTPRFTEHSYRTFAADRGRGEIILFQASGGTHCCWALRTAAGGWLDGELHWPAYDDASKAPYPGTRARVLYPNAVLSNGAAHYCGISAHNTWQGSQAGDADRGWGNRTRRLDYAWTPDITSQAFCEWIAIDDCFDSGGWISTGDMHLSADGTVHIVYARNPMSRKLRDARHPEAVRSYSIRHVAVRDGAVGTRSTVWEAVEGSDELLPCDVGNDEHEYLQDNGVPIVVQPFNPPRFHVMPDGRLFVLYFVSSASHGENRLTEILPDGSCGSSWALPLRHPLTSFFVATPRAGCAPSHTIDLLGSRQGSQQNTPDGRLAEATVSYARLRLDDV